MLIKSSNEILNKIRWCLSVSRKCSSYTHFGFQTVKEEEKQTKVNEVFENVATRYDLMNDAMSMGVHRLWKDCFVSAAMPTPDLKCIDVAGGTGDIAFRLINSMRKSKGGDTTLLQHVITSEEGVDQNEGFSVTVCDINSSMMEVGRKRAESAGISSYIRWVEGNAESLPFESNTFDLYTIAFGIRNCTNVQQVLNDSYRVLKPYGRFMCLEFSHVNNILLSALYDQYSFQVIPVLGQLLAGDWRSYQYLVESIRQFPDQEHFAQMMRTAGFSAVHYTNYTGGIAAVHSGFKLPRPGDHVTTDTNANTRRTC